MKFTRVFLFFFLSLMLGFGGAVLAQHSEPDARADLDSMVGATHGRTNFTIYLVADYYERLKSDMKDFKDFFYFDNPERLKQSLLILSERFSIDWAEGSEEFIKVGGNIVFSISGDHAPHSSVIEPDEIKLALYPSWNTVIVFEGLSFGTDGESASQVSYVTIYGRKLNGVQDNGVDRYKVLLPTMETKKWLKENGLE